MIGRMSSLLRKLSQRTGRKSSATWGVASARENNLNRSVRFHFRLEVYLRTFLGTASRRAITGSSVPSKNSENAVTSAII